MTELHVGYARVSTDEQDLTAQRDALAALGVEPERIDVDHGLTGTSPERPGLRQALAACRAGDAVVVSKLDRLARSLRDAWEPRPIVVVYPDGDERILTPAAYSSGVRAGPALYPSRQSSGLGSARRSAEARNGCARSSAPCCSRYRPVDTRSR